MTVRLFGSDARTVADRFCVEMLVRMRSEGEEASYMGLMPAGTDHGEQLHLNATSAARPRGRQSIFTD